LVDLQEGAHLSEKAFFLIKECCLETRSGELETILSPADHVWKKHKNKISLKTKQKQSSHNQKAKKGKIKKKREYREMLGFFWAQKRDFQR